MTRGKPRQSGLSGSAAAETTTATEDMGGVFLERLGSCGENNDDIRSQGRFGRMVNGRGERSAFIVRANFSPTNQIARALIGQFWTALAH